MERHLMTSAMEKRRRTEGTGGVLSSPTHPSPHRQTRPRTPQERPRTLSSVSTWTHTLALEGELTHRSAHDLEVELERLCEEGVTSITLDLRDLRRIDPVGVAVIAFRAGLCERRGYGFELIEGGPSIQRAFDVAGVLGLLPFRGPEQVEQEPVEVGALEAIEITAHSRESCEA